MKRKVLDYFESLGACEEGMILLRSCQSQKEAWEKAPLEFRIWFLEVTGNRIYVEAVKRNALKASKDPGGRWHADAKDEIEDSFEEGHMYTACKYFVPTESELRKLFPKTPKLNYKDGL